MERSNSRRDLINATCFRENLAFATRLFITTIVIITSIVNLSLDTPDKVLWVSLLSSCIGLAYPGLNAEIDLKKISETAHKIDRVSVRRRGTEITND